tara:strand:- start:1087 stop:1308 length:222 start_codon:yes stop_codon:yes gene_type:complete
MKTSYDSWKLSCPEDDETISRCCGEEYSTDDNDLTICSYCEEECRIIDASVYCEEQREYHEELVYEESKLSEN